MPISHVKCREIQAPIAAMLIRGFIEEFGYDETLDIVKRLAQADAKLAAGQLAERFGGNDMRTLARIVREVWSEDDAMEFDVIAENDHEFRFNVTKCGYAEVYRKLDVMDFGYCLSCCRDEPFVESFNPDFRLLRTKTIMEGKEVCDFHMIAKRNKVDLFSS